jgi:hypothetical protein
MFVIIHVKIDQLTSCYLVEVQNANATRRMPRAQETDFRAQEERLKQEKGAWCANDVQNKI